MKNSFPGKFWTKKSVIRKNLFLLCFFSVEDGSSEILLNKGETVIVIGNSQRRGHLVVEKHNHTIHVPFQYLEMKRPI